MKALRGSFAAKLTAVFLLCALVLVFTASLGFLYTLSDWDAYTGGYNSARQNAVNRLAEPRLYEIWDAYQNGEEPAYISPGGNFRFTLIGPGGEEIYSNYDGEETIWQGSRSMHPDIRLETHDMPIPALMEPQGEIEPEVTPTPSPTGAPTGETENWPPQNYSLYDQLTGETITLESYEQVEQWRRENSYTVRGYVLSSLSEPDDFSRTLGMLERVWSLRYGFLWAAGLSFMLGVLLFIFLLSAAGWHKGEERPRESFADRIPFDLLTLLILTAVILLFMVAVNLGSGGDVVGIALMAMLGILIGLCFLFWCMSFAVRVKCGSIWKNNLICRLWCLTVRGMKALPLLGRWTAILAGCSILELLLLIGSDGEAAGILWMIHSFLICPAALYIVWQIRKLRLGAKEIAAGNLDCTVDSRGLFWDLKDHAADLNHIRDGLNAAVEERMRSERFRTELITNVSHDIKTPLTSIINYVDLLEKEEPKNERQREYLEVLSRQSARLKKLIDDLIEASKASTGNLPVELERCELGVLLDQCAGEYSERLQQAELELLLSKPETPVTVLADGRHMWRIFDNLLGNIVKYAQPGTRVYLDLTAAAGMATVTFRNISRSRLNISGEELMERFVRGDSSRSTEGSGLGLSIAQSLTRLQKGEMDLTVDGDLFKVTLRFPAL